MNNILDELALLRLPQHRAIVRSRVRMRSLQCLPAAVRRALHRGDRRYCTVCESHLNRLLPFGPILDEWCPVCASMSRHRMLWHAMERIGDRRGAPARVLHLAPEPGLEQVLRRRGALRYTTADLTDPNADDRAAMSELARVLAVGGTALIMVPFHDDEVTDEDPGLTDPAEREARFGQHDHVRYYGRDIVDRLTMAGFRVHATRAKELLSADQLVREAVPAGETVFVCTKPD